MHRDRKQLYDNSTVVDCDFSGDGAVCPTCGYVGFIGMRRNCDRRMVERVPRLPPLNKRLANFSRSSIEHAQAGLPTCTQDQIDERHAACVKCDLYLPDKYNPAIGHCCHESCGCPITQLGRYVSKLAWADQKCPLGKWPAIEPANQ